MNAIIHIFHCVNPSDARRFGMWPLQCYKDDFHTLAVACQSHKKINKSHNTDYDCVLRIDFFFFFYIHHSCKLSWQIKKCRVW